MKLVILQDYLRGGGTENQSLFLADSLRQFDYEITVLTFRPGGVLAPRLKEHAIKHQSLQPCDLKLNFFAPLLTTRLKQLSPDLVLLMGRMANNRAEQIKHALPGCRVIATVRTGKPLPAGNMKSVQVADTVLVNSQWWADELGRQKIETEKIHVIPNAFFRKWDIEKLHDTRTSVRREERIPEQDCVFINVAGFRAGKNQAELLRACASLDSPNWRLWFVGDGSERKACEILARTLGIHRQVRFFGFRKDPFAMLAAADVAVSASTEDALPNFLVEAQWIGLPVVAVDYRGVKECFEHKVSGLLCPPHNAEVLKKSMQHYQNDREARSNAGKEGRKRALKHYAPEQNARTYHEVFKAE